MTKIIDLDQHRGPGRKRRPGRQASRSVSSFKSRYPTEIRKRGTPRNRRPVLSANVDDGSLVVDRNPQIQGFVLREILSL